MQRHLSPWLQSFAIHSITVLVVFLLFLTSKNLSSQKKYYRAHLQVSSKNSTTASPAPPRNENKLTGQPKLTSSSAGPGPTNNASTNSISTTNAATEGGTQDQGLPIPVEEYLVTQMPSLKNEVLATYPPEAKAQGIEGSVVTQLLIDEQGKVVDVQWVEGPAIFRSAATQALKQFTFNPAKIGQDFVPVQITYRLNFKLSGR